MVVHPLSMPTHRLTAASLLQSGDPTAPRGDCLPLLPPGPGGVHRPLPRRTQSSTPLGRSSPNVRHLEGEFDPAIAACGYRAPLAPHLARPCLFYLSAHFLSNYNKQRRGRDLNPRGSSPTRFPIVRTRPDYATSPYTPIITSKKGLCKTPFASIIVSVVEEPTRKGSKSGFHAAAGAVQSAILRAAIHESWLTSTMRFPKQAFISRSRQYL
jgi:hypothetical protein